MATATGEAPYQQIVSHRMAALAVTVDAELTLAKAQYASTVSLVEYIPDAALTGDNTNHRVLTLFNRKADASGTVVVATIDLVTGANLVKWVVKSITLSAVAGALDIAAGDSLTWSSVHNGSEADPGGLVRVVLDRN